MMMSKQTKKEKEAKKSNFFIKFIHLCERQKVKITNAK